MPDLDLYDAATVDADLLKMDAQIAEDAARSVPGILWELLPAEIGCAGMACWRCLRFAKIMCSC